MHLLTSFEPPLYSIDMSIISCMTSILGKLFAKHKKPRLSYSTWTQKWYVHSICKIDS